jgi:protein MpaA
MIPTDLPSLTENASEKVRRASAYLTTRLQKRNGLDLRELLLPLTVQSYYSKSLTPDTLLKWSDGKDLLWIPRFRFQRTRIVKDRIKLGIFAGIHGDEPAGILGVMDFLRELDRDPEVGRNFELWIYPVCNPGGCLDGTRHLRSGNDPNRLFWQSSNQPEIAALEQEIAHQRFDGIIALHSDDTSPGFYGYARGNVLARELLAPALKAAQTVQDIDRRPFIDGFRAVNGILHDAFDGILSAPPTQTPQPFEIILESPANSPIDDQRLAFQRALIAILDETRRFVSFSSNL